MEKKDIKFVVDEKYRRFSLFLGDTKVSVAFFSIENPDELFNQKYVGVFKLLTNPEFRGKGYMGHLLEFIFDYIKNTLNIDYILLNVYKKNVGALNLYHKKGFEIYKDYDNDEDEDPYFTLIKKLS